MEAALFLRLATALVQVVDVVEELLFAWMESCSKTNTKTKTLTKTMIKTMIKTWMESCSRLAAHSCSSHRLLSSLRFCVNLKLCIFGFFLIHFFG